jgi:hypothetical protein
MKTNTQTLAAALRQLASDIDSPDGVANAAIAEAAERLEELHEAITAAVYGTKLDDCGNRDENGLLRFGNPNDVCRLLLSALQGVKP